MIDDAVIAARPPGGMVLPRQRLVPGRDTELVRRDGRPHAEFRAELRRIPSARNALSVVSVYAQTALVLWATVRFGPWTWPLGFVLMGRAHAQFASLMHEAAHRLLFANRKLNDLVGRWLLGYPSFTSTDAYRRVHMAHHRQEFGPDEPDIPLYSGYPIGAASLRRKLLRDLTGRTGLRLFREQAAGFRSPNPKVRRTLWKIVGVQLVLLAVSIAAGYPLVYPLLWLLPFLTVWRLINRLRSIAEHGGLEASSDRRVTTHSVSQHALARFLLVPYNIGWHLAHHVDAGVPFRNLPRYHRAMIDSGYVGDGVEYPSYRAIWRALAADRPV
ncbi:MAG: fatty acid desaturase family protein [Ilumatobacteraceae bacterium]